MNVIDGRNMSLLLLDAVMRVAHVKKGIYMHIFIHCMYIYYVFTYIYIYIYVYIYVYIYIYIYIYILIYINMYVGLHPNVMKDLPSTAIIHHLQMNHESSNSLYKPNLDFRLSSESYKVLSHVPGALRYNFTADKSTLYIYIYLYIQICIYT
jgi:hypothetical protein